MTVKPKSMFFLAIILVLIVVSLPVQSALLYQNSLAEIPEIFSKITLINWIMTAVLLTTAWAAFRVHPILRFLTPIAVATVGYNNYLSSAYATDYSPFQTLLATGTFAVLFAPLMNNDIRFLLNNPKKRWWERSPRRNMMVPVTVNPYVGQTLQTKTFDISETGAFICIENYQLNAIPKIGERVKLNLNVNTLKKIRCEAIIVRVEEAKGIYPRGIGVRFLNFAEDNKRNLTNFLGH